MFRSCDKANQPTLTFFAFFPTSSPLPPPTQEDRGSHGLSPNTGQMTGKKHTHTHIVTHYHTHTCSLSHTQSKVHVSPFHTHTHTLPHRFEPSVPTPPHPEKMCHIDAEKQVKHSVGAAKWDNCNIDCAQLMIKAPQPSKINQSPPPLDPTPLNSNNIHNNLLLQSQQPLV